MQGIACISLVLSRSCADRRVAEARSTIASGRISICEIWKSSSQAMPAVKSTAGSGAATAGVGAPSSGSLGSSPSPTSGVGATGAGGGLGPAGTVALMNAASTSTAPRLAIWLVMSSPSTSLRRASIFSSEISASPKTFALASPSSSSRASRSDSRALILTMVSIAARARIATPRAAIVDMRSISQVPSPPRWLLMSLRSWISGRRAQPTAAPSAAACPSSRLTAVAARPRGCRGARAHDGQADLLGEVGVEPAQVRAAAAEADLRDLDAELGAQPQTRVLDLADDRLDRPSDHRARLELRRRQLAEAAVRQEPAVVLGLARRRPVEAVVLGQRARHVGAAAAQHAGGERALGPSATRSVV
jgi:hypothetical protein